MQVTKFNIVTDLQIMLFNVTHSHFYSECNKERGSIAQLYIELGFSQTNFNQKIKIKTKDCHSIKGYAIEVRNQHKFEILLIQAFYVFLITVCYVSCSWNSFTNSQFCQYEKGNPFFVFSFIWQANTENRLRTEKLIFSNFFCRSHWLRRK